MTNETLLTALSVLVFLSIAAGVGLSKAKRWFSAEFYRILSETHSRLDSLEQNLRNTENSLASHVSAKTRGVHAEVTSLGQYIKTHSDVLIQQTETMKNHAKELLDKSAAQAWSNVVHTPRAICSSCGRLVHEFKTDMGVVICGDCSKR